MSVEVQTCGGAADGDGSSTAEEQLMALMKEDETVASPNEESLAIPADNSSTNIVERPHAILKGSESGKDMPRERTGCNRNSAVWCSCVYGMDDDVVDLGQIRVDKRSEGVSQQSISVAAGIPQGFD